MQQSFNFDRIGKQMPYSVPEDFFSNLETSLCQAAVNETSATPAPMRRSWKWMMRTTLSAAAMVAVILSLTMVFPRSAEPEGLSVEQAFSNLSTTDQDYIIDTFRNDMIIDY